MIVYNIKLEVQCIVLYRQCLKENVLKMIDVENSFEFNLKEQFYSVCKLY